MAQHDVHYIEKDSSAGNGFWVIAAVLIVLFAILLLGSSSFSGRDDTRDINIRGNIETPGSSSGGPQ